jgi:DNA-binding GntR family transcriptional regulator
MPVPEKVKAVSRPPVSLLAFEQLKQWIEDGTLVPGEVIKDTEIAAKLGVSRTPIREAFQRLDQVGLVITTRNTRTEVAPASPEDAQLLYPPLALLHELAAESAVGKMQPQDFDAMTKANDRLAAAVRRNDPVAASQADDDFHAVLLDRAGNPFLRYVADWLAVHARRMNTLYFTHVSSTVESFHEHQDLIDALREGDKKRSMELARRNILRSIDVIKVASATRQ